MLLFIKKTGLPRSPIPRFQYISCYCLSQCLVGLLSGYLISIHLMLLFITLLMSYFTPVIFISIHLMLLFIMVEQKSQSITSYFNTSHVTVYLSENVETGRAERFQYISCYCLSRARNTSYLISFISIHLMLLFIWMIKTRYCISMNFNTSHVTVYLGLIPYLFFIDLFQYISCYCLSRSKRNDSESNAISIHLMLLFIHLAL